MPEYQSIKTEVLRKLEAYLPEIRTRFGIETLGIFGSVSRGEDKPDSDIDILYKFATPTVNLRQFMGLKYYLEELFRREVDLVGIDWIEPAIAPYIHKDMIMFSLPESSPPKKVTGKK